MTNEELIANELYHTCGRCEYGDTPSDNYPCNQCIHGFDNREDFWKMKEEVDYDS